jgi:uncharacterized membrane protein YraQ (UPF0718 family)
VRLGTALAAAGLAAAVVTTARLVGAGQHARLEEFALVFVSIVVEALPFILLGAVVSSLIAVYAPAHVFARIAELPATVQIPGAVACAFAFPVCECGSVPVARRLMSRGIHPAAGIAFMLAAPIVNPVVLVSTWVAYSGTGDQLELTAARAGIGLAVALAAGVALRNVVTGPSASGADDAHGEHCAVPEGGVAAVGEHLATDALFMGKFLVLGAAAAAFLQTMVPRDLVTGLSGAPVLGALALMALAFMLSLCSEADAFVAVSFSSFGLGPQLAFLAIGPVIDLKLVALYGAVFPRRFVPVLLAVAVPIVLLGSLLCEVVAA